MVNKKDRAIAANKWLDDICMEFPGLVRRSVNSTCIYDADNHCYEREIQQRFRSTKIRVVKADMIAAAFDARRDAKEIGVLNFASYKNPGGGFLKGSLAQEESLCTQSTLYPALDSQRYIYYTQHKDSSPIYDDEFIHTQEVFFFRKQNINSTIMQAHVVTAAAPNLAAADDVDEARARMVMRMDKVYKLFAYHQCDTVILGAWGCGVFKHDPKFVAEQWGQVINAYPGIIKNVVFAVPGNNYDIFREVFKGCAEIM